LRISTPRPDFALRVTPSSLNIRGGASAPLMVYALRHDGFSGAISLRLKDAPAGFALAAAQVPTQQDKVPITVTVPLTDTTLPLTLHIEGRAQIQGREVAHIAVPADDLMQAFAYRHLVPAQELKVAVWGHAAPHPAAKVTSSTPIKIPAGGTVSIEVSLPADSRMGKIEFDLHDAPDGLTLKSFSSGETASTLVVAADAAKLKAGTKGNLVFRAVAERAPETGDTTFGQNKRRIPLGALPAVPFEIIPP
jgi:hypothetical protein